MSLSFKTKNISSSTKVLLTKEEIDFVLLPVDIVLQQPEEAAQAQDTGPIYDNKVLDSLLSNPFQSYEILTSSARPDREILDNQILDNVPFIKESDIIDIVFTGQNGGRTGAGSMTIRQLTDSVIRDFQDRMNPEAAGAVGPFLPQDGMIDTMIQTDEFINNINDGFVENVIDNINIVSIADATNVVSNSMIDIVNPMQYAQTMQVATRIKFIKV